MTHLKNIGSFFTIKFKREGGAFLKIYLFLTALNILAAGIMAAIFIVPQKIKKVLIGTVFAVIIIFCTAYGLYLLNPAFRQEVNMRFNTENHHRVILNNQSFYLPLPNKTTLSYRTSEEQAVYITRASLDDISDFYSFIADNDSYSKSSNAGKVRMSFKYHDINYVVEAEDNIKSRKITILVI